MVAKTTTQICTSEKKRARFNATNEVSIDSRRITRALLAGAIVVVWWLAAKLGAIVGMVDALK